MFFLNVSLIFGKTINSDICIWYDKNSLIDTICDNYNNWYLYFNSTVFIFLAN